MTDDAEDLSPATGPVRRRHALRWFVGVAATIGIASSTFVVARVIALERGEFSLQGREASLRTWQNKPDATRISARLVSVQLRADQISVFELCSAEGLQPARWQGALEFVVLHLEGKRAMVRVPLDAAHLARVRRNSSGGCLLLGSGPIERSGTYTVDAVWPD